MLLWTSLKPYSVVKALHAIAEHKRGASASDDRRRPDSAAPAPQAAPAKSEAPGR